MRGSAAWRRLRAGVRAGGIDGWLELGWLHGEGVGEMGRANWLGFLSMIPPEREWLPVKRLAVLYCAVRTMNA